MINIHPSQFVEPSIISYFYPSKSHTTPYPIHPTLRSTSSYPSLTTHLLNNPSLSPHKSKPLHHTKTKGLTLSSNFQLFGCKKLSYHQNIMFNPQIPEDIHLIRRKTSSTLLKTSHTIHFLGKSITKTQSHCNHSISILNKKYIQDDPLLHNPTLMSCSLPNQPTHSPETNRSYSLHQNKLYTVKITPPKHLFIIQQTKRCSHQSKDKLSKFNLLHKKHFLRSSKKQNQTQINNNPHINHFNPLTPPPNLKSTAKQLEVKSKRQFLQSYIEKPMINSIILSGKVENLTEEPESPVLRLKKRLQLNSINCIYEKETIVSNQFQDNMSSTLEVQQSLIVHRNISENIRPLTHKMNLFSEGDQNPYKLYLGQEIYANLVVTVKELPLEYFKKFTNELRMYQQIESQRMETRNILLLIKHSTDSDKHILLKEAYTETLQDYLQNYGSRKAIRLQFEYVGEGILGIVRRVIEMMEGRGMRLRRGVRLNDLVYVFRSLKFENMEMFEVVSKDGDEGRGGVDKEVVLEGLRGEIESYLNRISSGGSKD